MKKRILSLITSVAILGGIFAISDTSVQASENEIKKVDGSYLTMEEYSEGHSSDINRGIHMMDGECSISKAGRDEIYCYGSTTANHEVDRVIVIVYVDQYQEDLEEWTQVDWWMVEDNNTYYVATGKSIVVDRGYYYRVHADHFVIEGDDPVEETFTATDGIYLPK